MFFSAVQDFLFFLRSSGLNADDLLMAVGKTRLRWRDQGSKEEAMVATADRNRDMQLIELAFRMGQSAAGGTACQQVASSKPQLLAIKDKDSQSDAWTFFSHSK